VEALRPERDLSRNPLFQVLFVLQNAPMTLLESAEMTLRPLAFDSATAKFDLSLAIDQSNDGLLGTLEYNADLFDASTIQRLFGHFQILLAGIVAEPDRRLAELPLLSEAERMHVLVEWNATTPGVRGQGSGVRSAPLCIHELFEAQVERTPDVVAVVF